MLAEFYLELLVKYRSIMLSIQHNEHDKGNATAADGSKMNVNFSTLTVIAY
jgi:hypothetical protein